MASRTMHLLRKYAKPVLAVMGVVCMITFVVGPFLIDLVSGTRAARQDEGSAIAVTWTKGQVSENELGHLRVQRNVVQRFLYNVILTAVEQGGTPVVNGQPISKGQPIYDVGLPGEDSDEALMQTIILAEEGRRMGVAVDHAAVKSYLKQMTWPELAEGDWLDIAQAVTRDSHLTVGQLFDHLAYELRADHVRRLSVAGLLGVPPGQVWDYFNRLNRRVTIDAYPIDVASLVPQVKGEPTAAELEKLFDQGRFRDPNPMLAEPGFHKPHKVAFAYLRVDFAPYLEDAKKQITDQQIEEQYQKDIAAGLHKDLSLPEAGPPADAKKDGDQPAEKNDAEQPANRKTDKPVENQPAGDKPKAEEPKTDQPKSDEPKTEGPKSAQPKDTEPDNCQAADPPAADQPPAADKPVENATAEKSAVDQPPAAKKDASDQPAAEKPAVEKTDEGKTAEAKPTEAKPAEAKPAAEPKFKPLSAVREDIRTQLARPIAQEAQDKAIKEAITAINRYGSDYRKWQTVKEFAKGKVSDPGKLDLKAIAARHGFKTGTTPLIDRFEAADYELGKNVMMFDFAALQRRESNVMRSFSDIAFGEDEVLYAAQEADSMVPDVKYVYFRTAEEKPADVTLANVRKQVVDAWRKQKAYELALADAQTLADKAKSAQALKDIVADPSKIITPQAFSWMTTGSLAMGFGQPEPSRVVGIDLAGREFMQAVFALAPGQTGVAPNQPHTHVYVVRMTGQNPSEEVLRQQFLETGLTFDVIQVAQREMYQTTIEWYREIEDRYQVKWQRPPRDSSRRAM